MKAVNPVQAIPVELYSPDSTKKTIELIPEQTIESSSELDDDLATSRVIILQPLPDLPDRSEKQTPTSFRIRFDKPISETVESSGEASGEELSSQSTTTASDESTTPVIGKGATTDNNCNLLERSSIILISANRGPRPNEVTTVKPSVPTVAKTEAPIPTQALHAQPVAKGSGLVYNSFC